MLKGVVFNAAEDAVTALHGAEAWDSILNDSGVNGAYTALGNYEEQDMVAIVDAAATLLEESVDDTWRIIGRHMLPQLTRRLGNVNPTFASAKELLTSVNDIIHPEVKMLYPDAVPPTFEFSDTNEGLLVHYLSDRGLLPLAEGLIAGCGDLFDEHVEIEVLPDSSPSDAWLRVTFTKA